MTPTSVQILEETIVLLRAQIQAVSSPIHKVKLIAWLEMVTMELNEELEEAV